MVRKPSKQTPSWRQCSLSQLLKASGVRQSRPKISFAKCAAANERAARRRDNGSCGTAHSKGGVLVAHQPYGRAECDSPRIATGIYVHCLVVGQFDVTA